VGKTKTRTTIADVAAAAGVHPSTVSRVLSAGGPSSIAGATARRVTAAADRLGYRPSAIARSLRLRRTLTLGMLVPDITNPFFSSIIKGAEDAARGRGYNLILCNTEDLPEREASYLAVLRERQVDGLLIASSRMGNATITGLRRDRFPFVLLNRSARAAADLAVLVDNKAGAEAVVAHLAGLGHLRVAHIAGPSTTTTGAERGAGFIAAARANGLATDRRLLIEAEAFSEAAGYTAARALLAREDRTTAIFAANDLIAIGALAAVREAGLRVPHDISIVGFNDIPLAGLLEPALTTVRVPQLEMGQRAAELLVARLEGRQHGPGRVILPTTLIVRASSAPPATSARRIA
jgi:LacI family transcriptional regulator